MKTMKVFLLASLVVTTGFLVACSSEDSLTDANANEDRGVVKTEFTISFPQTTTGVTRMSANTVQVPGEGNQVNFRGIKEILLYPFSDAPADIDGDTDLPMGITLYGGTSVAAAGASGTADNTIVGGSDALYSGSKAHLYKNVDIAIGTKSFIFYGEAATTSGEEAWHVGGLNRTLGTKLSNFSFSPMPIYTYDAVSNNGVTIAAYLTSIANTTVGSGATAKAWKDTENVGLATLYTNFTHITTGAWANVKAAVQRVYTNLAPRTGDIQATLDMKAAIRTAIVNGTFGVTVSDGTLSFSESYDNYPADMHLPDGAAYITWNETNSEFTPIVTAEHNTGMDVAPLSRYAHPASLYYWVKSGIKTSEAAKDSYSPTETWTNIVGGYTDGAAVSSKTRSIVIEDPVQYAVARLDLTLQAATTLKDGEGTSGKTISLTDGGTSCFPITGIIIGGQKPVDYKFEQITSGTPYTMYDTQVADGGTRYLSTTKTSAIHTLVLETNDATSSTDEGADVQIAVELQNNGQQIIVGYNGQFILPGTKFYLIGTLHPWKEGETIKRAFKQDHTTIANLIVSSLKNAHSTLPDLGVPQMDLGVSVNLTWQPGVTHEITID